MSKQKLPDCPAWCAQAHERPGLPHLKNIDNVRKSTGHISVEVNLIQDADGPYVQVCMTDHALRRTWPEEYVTYNRFPIDLAGTWGHIGTEMDARGAGEVAELLVLAANTFWEGHCRHVWCTADHADPEWETAHRRITIIGDVEVIQVLDGDPAKAEDPSFVRLAPVEGGTLKVHDFSPREARDLADLLQELAPDKLGTLADAITRAAIDLGATK